MNQADRHLLSIRRPNHAIRRLLTVYHRPLRFAMVGVAGATVNSMLLFTFITLGRLDPVLAGGIATEFAILFNFSLNDSWTFRGAPYRRAWPVRAVRYNMIAGGGLCVSVGTLALMIHGAHLTPMIANLFALSASFVVNYLANKHFTFVRRNIASESVGHAPASS